MARRLSLPALAFAVLALLTPAAAPAATAPAGSTFLTGGLALPAGAIAGADSGFIGSSFQGVSVSTDGRFVAFVSAADTFDPAAHPDALNVFRKDRLTGEVVLVSRADGAGGAGPAADSVEPVISADGSRVAFLTTAKLAEADTDAGARDVYVRDVPGAGTSLASQGGAGRQTTDGINQFDLSGDGQQVAFATSTSLAIDDPARSDVYRRDLNNKTTALVSVNAAGTAAGNQASSNPSISDDGTWIAFLSAATDVAAPYTPGTGEQVFARDMVAGSTHLVSARAGAATTGADGRAFDPVIAGAPASRALPAVVIAYSSVAINLAPDDDRSIATSIYMRRLSIPDSELVSRNDAGQNAATAASGASINDDGTRVAFFSEASNLPGAPGGRIVVRDVASRRTVSGSIGVAGDRASALSGDGSFLAWSSSTPATADSDPDLASVVGRVIGPGLALDAPQLVSRPAGSAPFVAPAFEVEDFGFGTTISGDGRYIVFVSSSARLPGHVSRDRAQVYRRDLVTGAIELVSQSGGGEPGDGFSVAPSIAADGTRVAFVSDSQNLGAAGTPAPQVYVRDLVAGTTTLVSRAEGADGTPANSSASDPQLSPDGGFVAFLSRATNFGAAGGLRHVYLRDVAGGHTTLIDRASAVANDAAGTASVSAGGRRVAFDSQATNLTLDDVDVSFDVYVRDVERGTTTLVSRRSDSQQQPGQGAATTSGSPSISADGSTVAFISGDETLAPEGGGWGGKFQVVARELASGQNVLVSRAPGGAPANDDADGPVVSGDGSVVAFVSKATNLLPGLGGGGPKGVFARTPATGALTGPPPFGLIDRPAFASISSDGECLAFVAQGHNAVTGPAGDFRTTYTHVVSGDCPQPPGPVGLEPPPRVDPGPSAVRPAITRASLSRKRFSVGRRATAKVAARKRRRAAPAGTTIRFSLNVSAGVSFAIERKASGRKVGRACRKPSARLRRKPRCVRWVADGTLTRRSVAAGRASLAFSGRIGRRALRSGAYRLSLTARNEAGASPVVRLPFTVVRR